MLSRYMQIRDESDHEQQDERDMGSRVHLWRMLSAPASCAVSSDMNLAPSFGYMCHWKNTYTICCQ